jgi:hypothetical protein
VPRAVYAPDVRVLSIVIGLLCLAIPLQATARPKPKIAVAPLQGDPGNKVAAAIVDALAGKDYAVIGPREVGRAQKRLGLGDELDAKATRKLSKDLGAVAIIDGKVSKAGRKRSLHLEIHRRGKPDAGFTIEFRSTSGEGFRRGVHAEVVQKLEGATEDHDDDDEAQQAAARKAADDKADEDRRRAEDDERSRKQRDDDERSRKQRDDDERSRKRAGDERKPRRGDDDAPARRKRTAEADDEPRVRKRRSRGADEPAAQILARVGAGAGVAQRQLTFDTRAGFTQVPPTVRTVAGSGRVDGELYPFALSSPDGALAGLGLAAAYDKTFGLSIKVPNQPVRAPISQSHYAIGARYRFGVGESSAITLGLDYARRQYVADRSGLMAAVLDAPDVDYSALAPGIAARVPVAASVAIFGGVDGMLILDAGQIQTSTSYGAATVYGVEAIAGVDIAVATHLGLRIAAEVSQINFSFNGKGAQANARDNDPTTPDVNGAADRSIGLAATLGLVY